MEDRPITTRQVVWTRSRRHRSILYRRTGGIADPEKRKWEGKVEGEYISKLRTHRSHRRHRRSVPSGRPRDRNKERDPYQVQAIPWTAPENTYRHSFLPVPNAPGPGVSRVSARSHGHPSRSKAKTTRSNSSRERKGARDKGKGEVEDQASLKGGEVEGQGARCGGPQRWSKWRWGSKW